MIDYLASWPHYWDHIAPVWAALPDVVKGQGDAVLVAGYPDLALARKLGYKKIALLEHGIGQSYGNANPGFPGGKYRDAVSLFLSPNETAAGMDRAAYPKARVEVVGCPRIDTLPRGDRPSNVIAISFHWGSDLAPELESTMPHYWDALPELARCYEVIGHAHPRIAAKMSRLYAKLGIEFAGDFEEVCRRADVYVADNTSTLYEFASTGRPVVVLNAPWYRRDTELGLRFWAAANVGPNADNIDELADGIDIGLDERRYAPGQGMWWENERETALNIVYQPRTNGAVYAATAILDWLNDKAVAA